MRAKNYENWLAVDKVIAKIIRLTFLAHPVYVLGLEILEFPALERMCLSVQLVSKISTLCDPDPSSTNITDGRTTCNISITARFALKCIARYNKKLSYRRETARQLPTWRGDWALQPTPLRPFWLHLCVISNPKPATTRKPCYRKDDRAMRPIYCMP